MRLEALIGSWHDTRRMLALMTAMALVLCLVVGALALQLLSKERVVVLVPPGLTDPLEVSRYGVTEDYLKSWGLFMAQTMGNVTPGTVRMVRATLEPLLAPGIYQPVIARLETEIDKIERDQVTLRFEPRRVAADPATGRVWVEGYARVQTIGEGESRVVKTYEFTIESQGYHPLITGLTTYDGAARTREEEPA